MRVKRMLGIFALALAALQSAPGAMAADLAGAWASDPAFCDKIFVKENNRISIASNSDAYGSGFILEGNQMRGKLATCKITNRSTNGAMTNIVAVCSTDVALSTIQFTFQLSSDDTLTRSFPGMPNMVMTYRRCPMR